jgi:hypothetical protein
MKTRVDNIRIKDLMSLLANLHHYCDAVDIIADDKERRIVINPTEETPTENPNKVELRDKDFGDII